MIDRDGLIERCGNRLRQADLWHGHGAVDAEQEAAMLVDAVLSGHGDTNETAITEHIDAVLRRRIEERIPMAYLTGHAWFAGRRYLVPNGVVIPRSPMAELIEGGLAPWLVAEPARILDLCCGSGCIGLAALHRFPSASVDLVDIDDHAIAAAMRNAAPYADRARVVQSDLFRELDGDYDLILCNPPYVPTAELAAAPAEYHHESRSGLDGGVDGLDVWRRIIKDLDAHLCPGGLLVGEVGNGARAFERAFPEHRVIWVDLERAEPQQDGTFGIFVLWASDGSMHP